MLAKNIEIQIVNTGEILIIADISQGIIHFTNGTMTSVTDTMEQLSNGRYTIPTKFPKFKGPEPMANSYSIDDMMKAYLKGIESLTKTQSTLPVERIYRTQFFTWLVEYDRERKNQRLAEIKKR